MNRLTQTAFILLATSSLVACGPGQNANQSATDQNSMTADSMATNPFAAAEKQMSDKMMRAVGSDVGQNWAVKMIEHHQGAIDMSRIMLEHDPTADLAKMAREGIDKQGKDINAIKALLKGGAPDQASAELFRPAMMEMDRHMMAAGGADVSDTFLRKMLEHHKGAVAMSDVALNNGVTGAMRAQIEKTKAANVKDSAMVEGMLSGKPMAEAKPSSAAADGQSASTTVSSGMPVPGTNTPEHVVVNEDGANASEHR